jgi:hypothetical protein
MLLRFNLRFLVVFVFIIQSNIGFSQVLLLGIKAGIGSSDLFEYKDNKISTLPDSHRLASFTGGFILNLKIKEKWFLHSEIIFEDKGLRTRYGCTDSIPPYSICYKSVNHNYYIQFPQTIRFLIPIDQKLKGKLYFEAGLYFACYILTKSIDNVTIYGVDHKYVDVYDHASLFGNIETTHRYDWGATLGIGMLMNLGKGQIDFNLRCDQMILAFVKDDYGGFRRYYNVISLTIGYTIPVINKDNN